MPGFSSTETVTCCSLGALSLIESHFLVDDQDFMHPGLKVWIAALQVVTLLMGLDRMRFEDALNGGLAAWPSEGCPV